MDDSNHLYFVGKPAPSETLYRGLWNGAGGVTGAVALSGVDQVVGNVYPADPFISHDGNTLLYDEFVRPGSGSGPTCVVLRLALKNADGSFAQLVSGDPGLAAFYTEFGNIYDNNNINTCLSSATGTLSLSHDGLMAVIGRIDFADGLDREFIATRASTSEPFGAPQLLAAAEGTIVENGSFSPDDSTIYYHKANAPGSTYPFSIWAVTRQ